MSTNNATPADAELILKLYDLRREPVMRQARKYLAGWWPKSAEDVLTLLNSFGSDENAYFRQVYGYWDMAATLALRGAVHEGLFFDNCAELFFMYAKVQPFLEEVRQKAKMPQFMKNLQTITERTPEARERLNMIVERQKRMRENAAAATRS